MAALSRGRRSLYGHWEAFLAAASRVKALPGAEQRLQSDETLDGSLPYDASEDGVGSPSQIETATKGQGVGSTSTLTRRLGYLDLLLLGIGASIGAGIFVITGVAAREAGPAVVVSFGLAGLASVFDALCYAELSARFPAVVGGAYMYAYATFGELCAFLVFTNLMLDYHVGAASIARSLASYLASLFIEVLPSAAAWLPAWLSKDGMPLGAGGLLSLNVVAPLILGALTAVLCQGLKESNALNSAMTSLKVIIVLLVIVVCCTRVNVANWVPFAPLGVEAVITGATLVFTAYVGFDAIANTAEEAKNPQRDLPRAIMGSLGTCAILYVCVCLVLTGMVPYAELDTQAPLATAFATHGLRGVGIVIDIGAVVGLTTTLLVGLYVQSRLYLGVGRDGLLPAQLAQIDPMHHTPVRAQMWVGLVAIVLSLFFDVKRLSRILSIGVLSSYSLVCACVVMLRLSSDHTPVDVPALGPLGEMSRWREGCACIVGFTLASFVAGLAFRWTSFLWVAPIAVTAALVFSLGLVIRQVYEKPSGFRCPWVPAVPLVGIAFNVYLIAQMHVEAWVRLLVVCALSVGAYVVYGQHHATTRGRPPALGGEASPLYARVGERSSVSSDSGLAEEGM